MSSRSLQFALASAVVTAIGLATSAQAGPVAADPSKDKCYGISMAGKNDCASTGNNSCAGLSKVDFDKGAWKYVAKGTCEKMEVTLKDGSKRMGATMAH